jgi:hypothetical protein
MGVITGNLRVRVPEVIWRGDDDEIDACVWEPVKRGLGIAAEDEVDI